MYHAYARFGILLPKETNAKETFEYLFIYPFIFLIAREIPIFIRFSFFHLLCFSIFSDLHCMQKAGSRHLYITRYGESLKARLTDASKSCLNLFLHVDEKVEPVYTKKMDKKMRKFYVHEWTFRSRYILRIHHRSIAAKRIKVRPHDRRNFSEKPFFRCGSDFPLISARPLWRMQRSSGRRREVDFSDNKS